MSTWEPLRLKVYRALWLASVVSNIGSTMNDTAAVWTMTLLTASPTMISLMQTMSGLPLFLLALPAGALADLVDRRRLIIAAQCGAFLTAAGLAVLAWNGKLNTTLLLLGTFQLGIAAAFTLPAWQAMVPEIVGRPLLPAALALSGVGFNLARALGPVAGGLLVAALGPAPVFALNAVSFLAVIAAMASVRFETAPRRAQQEQMLGAITAALRYVRHAPPMQAVLWRAGVHVFAAVAPVALLPIILRQQNANGSAFGLLMGCYGTGAIIMAILIMPKLRDRFSFDQVLAGAGLTSAGATILLAFLPCDWKLGAALAVAGGAWMAALNTCSVASQSAFPNWVRARSSAIYLVVVQGAFALGALTWGGLTSQYGAPAALASAGGWLLVSTVLARWLPISHLEKLDLTPSNHWRDHTLATEPAPEDGPVLITINYQIDPTQAAAFRAAMRLLRETRLRDGAFRCSVFVDLNDPGHYRETFLVGSWAEHLRQHARATIEDERIEAAVVAFHRGETPPAVRHYLMINLRDAPLAEDLGEGVNHPIQ